MHKSYTFLAIASCIAVVILGYLDSLQYGPDGRPSVNLIEILIMGTIVFLPAAVGLKVADGILFSARSKWVKLTISTLLCTVLLTLEISILLDWTDEFLDGMYAEEITNPYLFVISIYSTYSLPCTLISYGLTSLFCRFFGVNFPSSKTA